MPTKEGLKQWLQLIENQTADREKREKVRDAAVELMVLICEYVPADSPLRAHALPLVAEAVAATSNGIGPGK